jgi:hypothetical protein
MNKVLLINSYTRLIHSYEEFDQTTILGLGEFAAWEENGQLKLKLGNGTSPFSELPLLGGGSESSCNCDYHLNKVDDKIQLLKGNILVNEVQDEVGTGGIECTCEPYSLNLNGSVIELKQGNELKGQIDLSEFNFGEGESTPHPNYELVKSGSSIQLKKDGSIVNSIQDTNTTYSADNKLIALDGTKFTTNIIHQGPAENSFEIFDGIASAAYSIAAGTSEKDAITPIVGSTLAGMIEVNAPTASGVGAIATGGGAEATSAGALAMGSLNRVGVTGFYWSAIGTNTITLSTRQGSGDWTLPSGVTFDWQVGDTISIVNNSKYPACAKITEINGHVITVDNLPFNDAVTPEYVMPDDYTIFACYKKDIATEGFGADLATQERWYPRSGCVTIGWAGTAFGIENLVSGSAGFAAGWNNWVAGDFGAAFGRDNITGYTSFAAGRENEVTSANCFAAGYLNKVKSNNSGAIGYNNRVSKSNSGSFIIGQNNTSSAPFQLIVGDGAQTSWSDADTGESRTFSGHFLVAASGAQADIAKKPWMANVFAVSNNGTASARRFSTCSEPVRQRKAISNDIQKDYSAAIGSKLTIENSYCLAAGINNTISAARAAAIGAGLSNAQASSVVIGQANEENTDRVFAIGWGGISSDGLTVNSRKTILTVNQNKIGGSGANGCYSKADRPSDVVTLGYLQNDFAGGSGTGLPDCSGYQDGAILVVRNGQWVIENPPTAIYTGEL